MYIILLGLGLYSVGGGYTGTSEAVVHFLVYSSSSSSSSIFCQLPPTTRCIYHSISWLMTFLAMAPASGPPPPNSAPHHVVYFCVQAAPAEPNRVPKKKMWEALAPELTVGEDGVAVWRGRSMSTSAGVVTAAGLRNANVS